MADLSTFPPPSPTIQSTRVQSFVEEDESKSRVDLETGNEVETVNGADVSDKEVPAQEPSPPNEKSESAVVAIGPPPDGGSRAWLAVVGVSCAGFCTFGFANAFGVFQAYYTKTIPGVDQFSIAWIGSLQYSLIFMPGLLAGHLSDIGHLRPMLVIASAVLGVAIGGASGFLFMPSLGVVPQYFLKKRSTAYGCTALGSSLGGTILPIALRKLMAAVGFKWTIRILGFIIATFLGVMVLCVRPRVNRKKGGKFPIKDILGNRPLLFYVAAVSIMWFGIYNPLTFFDVYAQEKLGIPSTKSFYVIVTANGASIIGRLGSGLLADKLGPLNVQTAFCASAAILTIAWPYTRGFGSLEVVAVLYGICSGVFVSLLASPTSHMVQPHQIGATIGFTGTCMAIGALVSAPIAGQIVATSGGLNFAAVGGYSGAVVLLACLFSLASRYYALGGWKGKF
ncbi:hypothetical protein FRC05_010866 [Tulasnella sp. 425]|nr:hypothetical protein FRC05_010866 [Tulasnella sp. 425]